MPNSRLVTLGGVARVFTGVSKHGRSVLLNHEEAEDRRRRGAKLHAVRLLGMSAIDGDHLDGTQAETVWVEEERQAEPYLIRPGDVLLASRSTALRSCVVPSDATGFAINSTLVCIRSEAIDPRLLVAYFRHPQGQAELLKSAGSSTAQMNITIRSVADLVIPLPPIDLQHRLGELLDAAGEQRRAAIEAAEKSYAIALQIAVDRMFRVDSQGGER